MSRTGKFASNAITSFLLQAVTMVAGLIIPRLMIETYGSEINGLLSSITQFVGYFALVEAGLASASIHALYKPLAGKNNEAVSRVVSATKLFYYQSGYIFVGLVVGCSLIYPFYVKAESLTSLQVGLLVLVLGCQGIMNFFVMAKYRALVTADQKLYVINWLSILSIAVNTIVIVKLTQMDVDIVLLRVVALLSVFIPPVVLSFYVKKCYSYIDYNSVPDNKALHRRWDALILQALGLVHTSVPIIIATIYTSLEQVSVYAVYAMVVIGVRRVIIVFSGGAQASFGELIALGDNKLLREVYNQYEFMMYSINSLIYATTLVLILPFIKLYTRGITDVEYYQPVIAFLFVINAILYSIKGPQGMLITSGGLFKETKYQTLAQLLIAVILGVILGKLYGIKGILIGLIVSNLYRDIDLFIYIPKKLNNASILRTFKRAVLVFIQIAIVYYSFSFIDMKIISYMTWLKWAAIVFVYALAVVVVSGMCFENSTFIASGKRVIRYIHGKN